MSGGGHRVRRIPRGSPDVEAARDVLGRAFARLNSRNPARRARHRALWERAFPVPGAGERLLAERDFAPPGARALLDVSSRRPEERFAAVRIMAALHWIAPGQPLPRLAGRVMAELGGTAANELVGRLSSDDALDRQIAGHALPHLAGHLVAHRGVLGDALDRYPEEAAMSVVAMGLAATDLMLSALLEQRGDVRRAVLAAIDESEPQWPATVSHAVVDALARLLLSDEENVPEFAFSALYSLTSGDDTVRRYLASRATFSREEVRRKVAQVLALTSGEDEEPRWH